MTLYVLSVLSNLLSLYGHCSLACIPACVHKHVHVYIHMSCVHNNLARVLNCISSQYCQGYKSIVWELAGIIELAIEYMPMRQKKIQNETEAIVIINKILNQT